MAIETTAKLVTVGLLDTFKGLLTTLYQSMFVAKESGKGLSTNDYTTAEKDKLTAIAAGAQVNVIESITVDGTAQTITEKAVALDLSAYAKKTDVASALTYKGSVANYAALPNDADVGDVYNVAAANKAQGIKAGDNVAWDGSTWDVLAGAEDLSGYVEKEAGKGLSTNDFTNDYKTILDGYEVATTAEINALFA